MEDAVRRSSRREEAEVPIVGPPLAGGPVWKLRVFRVFRGQQSESVPIRAIRGQKSGAWVWSRILKHPIRAYPRLPAGALA